MSQSAIARHAIGKKVEIRRPVASAALIGSLEQVTPGSVLIRPGTALPDGLAVLLRRIGRWNLVADLSSSELDRLIGSQGWHLFYLVPPIEGSGLGLDFHRAFRKALTRVVGQVELRGLNALEVTEIRVRQLVNVHYVRITAHPRHVRNSPFPRDLDPHHQIKGMWNFTRMFNVRNRKVPEVKGI